MKRFESLEEVARYLRETANNANTAVARALNDEASNLLDATIPVTPIEWGPLRASGRITQASLGSSSINAEVKFGGPAAGYAIYVHERVVNRRTGIPIFHASPTRAKFLSSTADAMFPAMMAGMWARTLTIFKD